MYKKRRFKYSAQVRESTIHNGSRLDIFEKNIIFINTAYIHSYCNELTALGNTLKPVKLRAQSIGTGTGTAIETGTGTRSVHSRSGQRQGHLYVAVLIDVPSEIQNI